MPTGIGSEIYALISGIKTVIDTIVPVTSSEYATTTSTAADAEIILATQHIDATNGVIVSISQDTYILLAQTTGGATTTSMIFKAGTHYIPFTFTHLVHKAVTTNGTITLIGKYVA